MEKTLIAKFWFTLHLANLEKGTLHGLPGPKEASHGKVALNKSILEFKSKGPFHGKSPNFDFLIFKFWGPGVPQAPGVAQNEKLHKTKES